MKLLTVADCAKELDVIPRRVQAMIKSGKLKATRVGRDWLIEPKDLAACKRDRQERGVGK